MSLISLAIKLATASVAAHQMPPALQKPINPIIHVPSEVVSDKLNLLRKAFKKYSLLYPKSIETDTYGGNFITFILSDKAEEILKELETATDVDLGWNGATIRSRISKILEETLKKTDIPSIMLREIEIDPETLQIIGTITLGDGDTELDDPNEELIPEQPKQPEGQILQKLIDYYDRSKRLLNGSEAGEIYSFMQILHSEYIVKALGFSKISFMDDSFEEIREGSGEPFVARVFKNPNINIQRLTQSAIIPDIESLRARIIEINKRLRAFRKKKAASEDYTYDQDYYIALDIYASGKQVVGDKYIRNFAERRALPIAALDRHPIVAEHDYSAHLKELLTITPELGEAFQSQSQDVIKLIDFLKRNYPGALDPLTREPRAFATGEDAIVADCINSLLNGMGRVLDADLLKVTPKTPREVIILKSIEVLKDEVNAEIHSFIELSFGEIMHAFIGEKVMNLNSLMSIDLDSYNSTRSAVIAKIKESFYQEHPDLKDKKYLPEGKIFVDYFVDAQQQIQYLNEFLKENPL